MDSRYPNLFRVKDAPGIHGADRPKVQRLAEQIEGRTGTKCVLVRRRDGLHLFPYLTDCSAGVPIPWGPVVRMDGSVDPEWLGRLDEACRFIQQVNRPRKEQDAIIRQDESDAESAKKQAVDKGLENTRVEARKIARRAINRAGMSKQYRPSALVDGFKKAG